MRMRFTGVWSTDPAGCACSDWARMPAVAQVREIELRRVRLPLVRPFRTALGTDRERDALIVRVATDSGEGWGECVAPREPFYAAEWVGGAQAVIREFLGPLLLREPVSADAVGARLARVKGHPMAKAALEMAVLDAELRVGRLPRAPTRCGAHVGGVRGRGRYRRLRAELLDEVDGYLAAGYRRVKLKIRPGWDIEPVAAFRQRFGDVPLQVDANGAYTLADATLLGALDPFELLLIEQPLAEDDLIGHAGAGATHRDADLPRRVDHVGPRRARGDRARRVLGGVHQARTGRRVPRSRRVHDVCRDHDVAAWCGGMLETGLGRAANLALAALPGFTLPGDLSASDRYFARDLTAPFVLADGRLPVPTAPGIGIAPDPDALRDFTTSIEVITHA